ncbi:hypothetical protein HJC23_006871, partial [Cyclotella cryptica]
LAPATHKALHSSTCPANAAQCRGVHPQSCSATSASAPCRISVRAESAEKVSEKQAKCRGVAPVLFDAFTLQPFAKRHRSYGRQFHKMAASSPEVRPFAQHHHEDQSDEDDGDGHAEDVLAFFDASFKKNSRIKKMTRQSLFVDALVCVIVLHYLF